ncbi:chromosome segregation protein SMC [Clostridium sp. CM027]|uniref:chromosome segregation protein SMC n=1 Tax=Clostridium sp. CM027 TaxID=2849865 RepID=UPI001C6E70EA|nr:chromosome segregation protein SMC [Clostridium sp. CM027]MBW9144113.1 chromosome segregation protein SMC [Clostridium sp. CM027]UVE41244.1 chromosome segregation protein SMC [Clostridium sp. CM027]
MFLKSIEIRGFKSFADKTELTFTKGITAVVGPNGSGKSNISDAVRWVLGEQSARNLRGDKMEDIIFAGTQFRKPVGLAQVSLILDNSDSGLDIDYSNVTISRRLYRSGESEYLINNTSCRLKDVQQLFMDTGIGKEGYSIIGQGKIDAILSGKTEERRKLFEEAAGIVKFKTRKEEAEKRLDSTDQNLIRIEDILSTYEERLEPLMNESEKAKKFLKLFEELKSKEVSIIIDSINKVEEKIKRLHDEGTELDGEVIQSTKGKTQFKKDVEYWNSEFETFENKNREEKQIYYNNKLIYQNNVSEIKILNERIDNLAKAIDKTSNESDIIRKNLLKFKRNKDVSEDSLNIIKNTQMEIVEKIQYEEIKIKGIEGNIAIESDEAKTLKEKEQSSIDKTIEFTNNLLILKNNMDISKKRIDTLKNNIENFDNSIKINANTKTVFESQMEEFKDKIVRYESKVRDNKKESDKLQNILTFNERTMKNCNFKINKTEANFNVLTTLEKKHEGYNKSVKNLMQHVNEGKVGNIRECFVLGEIIKVEKNLEVAIEIALGGSISHIITKDETVAKLLIDFLKVNNLGRATFLPLNIIKGKRLTIDNETKNNPGFVGMANELISYDEKFSEVIAFILGRTIICKDMNSALQISKKNNFRYKIVTLSGEIINVGGSLTGGSVYSKTSSIIGRKREIKELAKDLDVLKDESIIYLEKIKQSKSEILGLNEENLNLKDKVHFENIEVTKVEAKVSSIINETNRLKNNIMALNTEKSLEEGKLEKGNKEIDEKNESVAKFIHAKDEIQQSLNKVDFKLKDKLQEIENIKESIIDAKIKKAQIDETIHNKRSEIQRLNDEISVYNEKIIVFSREIEESMKNKNKNLFSIQSAEVKVKEIMSILEKTEKKFEDNEIKRIKIKEHIKISVEHLENVSQVLEKTEKEMHKCELALAKVKMEKDTYYQKLNDDFELTYAEALQFKNEIEDIDKLKKEIIALKAAISMLGKINVSAIEEYKEVKDKFTFMNGQKEDLVLAKNELLTVIGEMTEKMKQIFAENFIILRQNFNETFTELFKGGSADLILTEGDELTAKIDINVQPPGKKLQNISLMSGGEKVLSAIALLFAILKMKPTPFCILDEIEAALDDANVVRYAEFLKRFSDNVQFIIITHRKGTMEAGDVLYGVTMEEKGVSKIVSVHLNK